MPTASEIIHDHPDCEAKDSDHVELTDEGNCRVCSDRWWDEIEIAQQTARS